jgi:hypothetical protein
VAYGAYFIYEWFFSGQGLGSGAPASPEKSLAGLFVFALPALWYTIFGRLTLRKPKREADGTSAVTVEPVAAVSPAAGTPV